MITSLDICRKIQVTLRIYNIKCKVSESKMNKLSFIVKKKVFVKAINGKTELKEKEF